MIKLKTNAKGVVPFLRILSKCGLKQITSRDEMVRWFDGDWGTYWFLFRTPDDSMRMDMVHQRDGTTRFATSFAVRGRNRNYYTSDGGIRVYTEYIPVSDLIKLCTDCGIGFEDPEFTYAASLYNG